MATNHWDLAIVRELVNADTPASVVPYLGVHPWYSHLYRLDLLLDKRQHYHQCLSPAPSDELLEVLPDPVDLNSHLQHMGKLALHYTETGRRFGIGEIGLDKLFRVPSNGFYGNQEVTENVGLTQCKVTMDHQKAVFVKQLELAHQLKKPVSLHCVKAHGPFFDIVSTDFHGIPWVVLHSYTGSLDQANAWIKAFKSHNRNLCFSFSNYINASDHKRDALVQLVRLLDAHQILTESDMPIDRFLPQNSNEYFSQLENVARIVAEAKNWEMSHALAQLRSNALQLH